MTYAVVDIGTNSVRLLVAQLIDNQFTVLRSELRLTRLGEGVNKNKKLGSAPMQRTIEALRDYQEILQNYDLKNFIATATSAVRDSQNKDEFIKLVKDQVGWEIKVISGDEEAELSFIGAMSGFDFQPKNPVVIDIGGGSTEFIWQANDLLHTKSLQLGSVRMTENGAEMHDIEKVLSALPEQIKRNNNTAIGVGGTFTTLAAIHKKMEVYDPLQIHGSTMFLNELESVQEMLESMTLDQRKNLAGLQPGRADVIVAGARIAVAALRHLNVKSVVISESDIMYGLLYRFIS